MQAETIVKSPLTILLIAIPLIIQTVAIFLVTYVIALRINLPHKIASPAAMIGASNFFELAVAVAISLFGLNSGAALATVVGVLVEVPVMLSLVFVSNRTKSYFQKKRFQHKCNIYCTKVFRTINEFLCSGGFMKKQIILTTLLCFACSPETQEEGFDPNMGQGNVIESPGQELEAGLLSSTRMN